LKNKVEGNPVGHWVGKGGGSKDKGHPSGLGSRKNLQGDFLLERRWGRKLDATMEKDTLKRGTLKKRRTSRFFF